MLQTLNVKTECVQKQSEPGGPDSEELVLGTLGGPGIQCNSKLPALTVVLAVADSFHAAWHFANSSRATIPTGAP